MTKNILAQPFVFSVFFDVERKTRFHVKRRAVISEAQGAYSGSAGRLFRKRWALILEALGAYFGRAWRFGWGCVEVWVGMWGGFGGNAGCCGGLGTVFGG